MAEQILELYTKLMGKQIPETLKPQYLAWATRALVELENKLGWSFSEAPVVNVLGVSPSGCDCDIAVENLKPAPEKRGEYKVFPFNSKQPNALIDPFSKVNAVYLCRIMPEGEKIHSSAGEVVILKQVSDFSPSYFNAKYGKYIKACKEATVCQSMCEANCLECSALLVDAEWLSAEDIPNELLYLIFGYMDWLAEDGPRNRTLKSESVDGHSVTYGTWRFTEPYLNPADAAIIQLFAGPYGMVDRKNIW